MISRKLCWRLVSACPWMILAAVSEEAAAPELLGFPEEIPLVRSSHHTFEFLASAVYVRLLKCSDRSR